MSVRLVGYQWWFLRGEGRYSDALHDELATCSRAL
jgi:hypothetical protein